jgi:hypothetical protein
MTTRAWVAAALRRRPSPASRRRPSPSMGTRRATTTVHPSPAVAAEAAEAQRTAGSARSTGRSVTREERRRRSRTSLSGGARARRRGGGLLDDNEDLLSLVRVGVAAASNNDDEGVGRSSSEEEAGSSFEEEAEPVNALDGGRGPPATPRDAVTVRNANLSQEADLRRRPRDGQHGRGDDGPSVPGSGGGDGKRGEEAAAAKDRRFGAVANEFAAMTRDGFGAITLEDKAMHNDVRGGDGDDNHDGAEEEAVTAVTDAEWQPSWWTGERTTTRPVLRLPARPARRMPPRPSLCAPPSTGLAANRRPSQR